MPEGIIFFSLIQLGALLSLLALLTGTLWFTLCRYFKILSVAFPALCSALLLSVCAFLLLIVQMSMSSGIRVKKNPLKLKIGRAN